MPKYLVYNENAIVSITKELTFDSAHFLELYEGKCAKMHGHTYKLLVTVAGKLDDIGMVLDFNLLKDVLNNIKDLFDHEVINEKIVFNPTAENLVVFIYDLLNIQIQKLTNERVSVEEVILYETPTSYAKYRGVRL